MAAQYRCRCTTASPILCRRSLLKRIAPVFDALVVTGIPPVSFYVFLLPRNSN
ncbi:hypothetical protein SDJN02_11881, partial [Cucurbita argyrosperma subsp. argyrosperma]